MKKILVIDDCSMVQDLISGLITRNYGIEVLVACNVLEGLLCLENEAIDFVICDYEMPGGNGLLVLDYLSKNRHSIPFILFSGRYEIEVPIGFPLIEVINDKSYKKLFSVIQKHQFFLENIKE